MWYKQTGVYVYFAKKIHMRNLSIRAAGAETCGRVALRSELTTSGRADAMLSGAHVTRTRYAHQVTAATLCMLQKRAHEQYLVRSVSGLSFEEWCTLQCEQQPQFKYWTITFHMQLLLLQFVRSIRERSFSMYTQ